MGPWVCIRHNRPYLNPKELTKFSNIIAKLRRANKDRNDAVHAYWVDTETGLVATKEIFDRGKIRFKSRQDLTPNALEAIASELYTAWEGLVGFIGATQPKHRQPYQDTLVAALRAYEQKPEQQNLLAPEPQPDTPPTQKDPPQS